MQPPFPAPPVEGKGKRIGIGFGIGAGVLLLICGGGTAALVGVGLSSSGAFTERAQTAVRGYLNALRDRKFDTAYDLLCDRAQQEESPAEFRSRAAEEDPIVSYHLGDLNFVALSMPVDATYSGGQTRQLEAHLGQDTDTGEFEVCDLGE